MLKRVVSCLALCSMVLVLGVPQAQALTMDEIIAAQGQVLGDTTYPTATITSATNKSLLVTVTPVGYANGAWTYKISWSRTKVATGSLYIFEKFNTSQIVLSIDNAAQTGTSQFNVKPSTAYTVQFFASSSGQGSTLLRKSFTSRPALSSGTDSSASASSGNSLESGTCLTGTPPSNAIWNNGCWRMPAYQSNSSPATGSTIVGPGYNAGQVPSTWKPTPNAPQLNNGLNGSAVGRYAGKSLASLGTRTSAPGLGGYGSCSLSPGWTVDYYNAQYGSGFSQAACGNLSKKLMLYSINYCTDATNCYHYDYSGQYKISRDVLEGAMGHTASTLNSDPASMDPFNSILFMDKNLEAKCVAIRQHGSQYDLYDAGCGTSTGEMPNYNPNGLNGSSVGSYAGQGLSSLGTRTPAAPLGSMGGSCSLSNGWTVNMYSTQYGGQFVQYACAALAKQLFLYSIDYCTGDQVDNCFHYDYTGQYKIPRNVLEGAMGHKASTLTADPLSLDPFNGVLFTDVNLNAKCVAPRNHGGQLDLYDAQCGTTNGYSGGR